MANFIFRAFTIDMKGSVNMSDNRISFGTTRIFYKNNNTPVKHYIDKLTHNALFKEAKGFKDIAAANKNLKTGQVGVVAEKDALALVGCNPKEDELIYNLLTENGNKRLPGSSYIQDHLDIKI